ncbi:MAG: acylphosphatase [Pseudomonadales bacterium]|nr:acylphosphatase [Pseudomonadales bacterium]
MCRLVLASGKVQGVGYRAFARRAAQELGIAGHARNLADGRVEILACGESVALDRFIERLQQGPKWSRVEPLDVSTAACCASGFTTA